MDFIDSIRIFVHSGNGGPGSSHFLRNKLTAKGGPDGGDGGRGGHIILRGNENLWTLHHLRYRKHILAKHGKPGSSNQSSGKFGEDAIIEVPLGTIACDEDENKVEAEIIEHGQEFIWIEGGLGGLGNTHFASSTRQAPTYAQPGRLGWEGWKVLELKLLADVGMVGYPNAGKSTLLSVLSAAKPRIADYPFTTLTPQLGIVSLTEDRSFCVADLPGIIKGASQGKGLGHRFLRHIERNAMLMYVISLESKSPHEDIDVLMEELQLFNPLLNQKDFVLVLTKSDLIDERRKQEISDVLDAKELPYLFVSAVTMHGIKELKEHLWSKISNST